MDILLYIGSFVLAVGILIVAHEFGHYWVARRLGVKVLRFSVGFGKPLWSKRIGTDRMELVVAAIPLGGYVKMLDENEGPVPAKERRRAFNRQPVWKRMAIVVAGPLFNFLFAILAYWLVFAIGIDSLKPVVAYVLDDSPAQHGGFRPGDEMLEIDGKPVLSWDHRSLYLLERALDRATVSVVVRDAGGITQTRALDLSNVPTYKIDPSLIERGIGLSPFPLPEPVLGTVLDGPAKRAGFEVGDRFRRVDGQPIEAWDQLVRVINANPGKALQIEIERDGARRTLTVVPDAVEDRGRTIGRINVAPPPINITPEMRTTLRLPVAAALLEGLADTWAMSRLTLNVLYRMLRLEISTENISGPIMMAQAAGQSAKVGFVPFVFILAVISIGLGVLNLLPIPVLDGGHLLYYIIEAIKGGPLPEKVMVAGQRIGIALLVALMMLALYNDITRIFR